VVAVGDHQHRPVRAVRGQLLPPRLAAADRFTAFLVALFTGMYGIPADRLPAVGWLGSKVPALQATHSGGHLWNDLIGWRGDPHLSPFHLSSYLLIGGGFWLASAAWRLLLEASRERVLVRSGLSAGIQRPQCTGFLRITIIMVGFLLQRPTDPALVILLGTTWVSRRTAPHPSGTSRLTACPSDGVIPTPTQVPWGWGQSNTGTA
jgi:hypothetical protein